MIRKNIIILFLLLLPIVGLSQNHERLIGIINSSESGEIKQQKIDSLLQILETAEISEDLANCYHDLGSKWFFRKWKNQGNKEALDNTIHFTENALKIKKGIDNLTDCSLNKTLYNLGFFNKLNQEVFSAIDYYKEIVKNGSFYCTDEDQDDKVLFAQQQLGELYVLTGDYYKAIELYDALIFSYKSIVDLSDADRRKLANAHIELSEIYLAIGPNNFSEEIKLHLNMADTELKTGDSFYSFFKNRIDQIEGNRLLEKEKYLNAAERFDRVLLFLSAEDSINLARVYNSIAISHFELNNFEKAAENLQKAIQHDSTYSDPYNNLVSAL